MKIPMTGAAMLLAAALPAAAQNLPNRDAVRWREVGVVEAFRYFVDPSSVTREGDTVTFLMRGSAPPSPTDGINTIVARVTLDCRARLVGVGESDLYREIAGFAQSAPADTDGLRPPSDPGQTLLLNHFCTPQT